jgi:ABC-type sugar transport system substrate-binding protein
MWGIHMNRMIGVCSILAGLLLSTQALAIGAIAVDDGGKQMQSGYGYSLGFSTQKAAETAAIAYCQEYGGTNCKAIVWFETCGAYAESSRFYGYGYGNDRNTAKSQALAMCSDKSCKILVAVCEGDE